MKIDDSYRRLVILLVVLGFALSGGRAYALQQGVTPVDDDVSVAQRQAGAVHGTVRDEGGGAVAGAFVALTDERRQTRQAVADVGGVFEFDDLTSGRYQLVVSRIGFGSVYRSVEVAAGRTVLVDVSMRVAIDQRVEVVASLEEFRRVSGLNPIGLIFGREELAVLPNDPDIMLAVLRELSATTGRADEVAVYVDGQPMSSRLPPKEIIQSIRISTNPFASEFAEPSSGLVEIVTKPAATSYRGEYQSTFNDSMLNARNAFEPRETPTRTQSYAGYVGGPIVPGRWGFLGYGGRWQRNDRLVVNTSVVDPATFAVRPFVESVATPDRIDSYSLRTDVLPFMQHVLAFEYGRSTETQRNAGLESGLDLPERAVNREARVDTVRLAAVSTFTDGFGSEFRLTVRRQRLRGAAVTTSPAVLVLDAFNAGGNQASLRQTSTTQETSLSHVISYADTGQSIRGGIQVDLLHLADQRLMNEGGTFTFGAVVDQAGNVVATPLDRYVRTLQGVPGYGPSSFSVARGEPSINFNDWRLSGFIQDDVQKSRTVTLSLGLRQDIQKHARLSFLNFAPRAGIAWTPNGSPNHTLRAAAGLFYSRIPPEITLDALRNDGVKTVELVVDQPAFFGQIPSSFDATVVRPTVRLNSPVYAPITTAATGSYEWHAARTLTASVGYTYRRGNRLLRTVNTNTPDPVSGIWPRPELGPMLRFESTGRSSTQELRVTLRHGVPPFTVFGTYALRSSRSDTDGLYTQAADSRTLQGEYGRASDDERHHLVLGSAINLPHDWFFGGLLTIGSGRPFNITTGLDNDGDLLFVDRPASGAAGESGVITTAIGDFNPYPRRDEAMIVRNAGQGPSQFVLNAGVAKAVRFGNGANGVRPYVVISANAENLTNRVNFTDFNGVVTSPLFGLANRALNPLRIEFAARFGF